MKCIYCQGETERKMVKYTVDRNGYHLFIREVPANVCMQCGERYFDEEEVGEIQDMIESMDEKVEKVRMAK